MPPCMTCCIARESILKVGRGTSIRKDWFHLATSSNAYRKGFTTSPAARAGPTQDFPSPRHEALTLLHKTSKLLPSIPSQKTTSGITRTGELWNSVLSQAYIDLSTTEERPIKVVVYGLDSWSGSRELVTALLADPLSSNPALNEALKDRWKSENAGRIDISYANDLKSGPKSIRLPSSYLSQFSVPLEIVELYSASKDSQSVSISQVLENPTVLEADIPIFVCNPYVTSISDTVLAQLPSNAIIVFSSSIPQTELDAIINKNTSRSGSPRYSSLKSAQFVAVDPKRAASAINLLQSDSSSLSAIQQYQDAFMSSQISSVTQALRRNLQDTTYPIRTKIALARIFDVLNASSTSLRQTRRELDQAFIDASNLGKRIEEIHAKIEGAIFEGKEDGLASKAGASEVADTVKLAEKEMSLVMDRMTWCWILRRVDEISTVVASAVSRTWCRELEKKLILQTGRLSEVQRQMSISGLDLLSKHPIIPSAVLQNSLLQLKATPSYKLTPESLTKPIYSRRDQIIQYPTTRLHVAGQRAVIGMTGGVVTGLGIGWAGWLGWLLGSGEGLLGFVGMDANTAMGVGMLSAVAGIRWGVGKWEKAKKRWWQDWTRVGQGLDRDLKATLDQTMRQQVTVVAEAASTGVSDLVKRREEELSLVSKELEGLQAGLDSIITKVEPKS